MTDEQPQRYVDTTLTADEINSRNIIAPLKEEHLKAVSYDLSVGEHVFLLGPHTRGGRQDKVLGEGQSVQIPGGWVAVAETEEALAIPRNVYGRVSTRTYWALRQLSIFGGLIDPGYEGKLWVPIRNSSQSPLSIRRGEGLASVVFIDIGREVAKAIEPPKRSLEQLDLFLDGSLPPSFLSAEELAQALKEAGDSTNERILSLRSKVDQLVPKVNAAWAILTAVVLGAVAGGLGATVIMVGQRTLENDSGPIRWVVAGVVLGLLVLIAVPLWQIWSQTLQSSKSNEGSHD